MGNDYSNAVSALPSEAEVQTVDQKIAYAMALAILSVSQEINRIGQGEAPFAEELLGVIGALGSNRPQQSGRAW